MTTIYLLLTLAGKGRRTNLHMATSMNCKWPTWPYESEKQAIIQERKLFSEICHLETSKFSEDLAGKFNLLIAHVVRCCARVVAHTCTDTHRQIDEQTTITFVRMLAEH